MKIGDRYWPWVAGGMLLFLLAPWIWLFCILTLSTAFLVAGGVLLFAVIAEMAIGGDLVIFFETLILSGVLLWFTDIVLLFFR